jgi:hypothetical protein
MTLKTYVYCDIDVNGPTEKVYPETKQREGEWETK